MEILLYGSENYGEGRLGIGTTNPSSPAGVGIYLQVGHTSQLEALVLDDTAQTATGGTALFVEQNTKDIFFMKMQV